MKTGLICGVVVIGACSVCSGQVISAVEDFSAGVRVIGIDTLTETSVTIPTPNSVNGTERRRYSNDILEVRAIQEATPGDREYGFISRSPVDALGFPIIQSNATEADGGFPFAERGLVILLETPVVEFGMFSINGRRFTTHVARFLDADGNLLGEISFEQTTNSVERKLAGFRSAEGLISRVELIPETTPFDGVPAVSGSFYVFVPSPGVVGCFAVAGLTAGRRRKHA